MQPGTPEHPVYRLGLRCKAAMNRRPGNRHAKLTDSARAQRVADAHNHPRWTQRLKRNMALSEWYLAQSAAGRTIVEYARFPGVKRGRPRTDGDS